MVTNTDIDKKMQGLVGDPQQPNFFNQPQQEDLDMLNTSSNKNSDIGEDGVQSDQENKKNDTSQNEIAGDKVPGLAFAQENPEDLPSDNEANLKEQEEQLSQEVIQEKSVHQESSESKPKEEEEVKQQEQQPLTFAGKQRQNDSQDGGYYSPSDLSDMPCCEEQEDTKKKKNEKQGPAYKKQSTQLSDLLSSGK